MEHLPGLISDLALILVTGAITTILFRAIKQPLVLGYVIAGFLVGPHLSITPTVSDIENVEIWAEIGVIFLLFSLGLEFSFRKLSRIGGSASVTAIVEILFIFLAGYLLGQAMGWSVMDSVFLGGMLASSSTTIISKAFDELKVKTQKFAGIVVGVLIVEDLIVILLMVLLSTLSATREIGGMGVLFTVLKLAFFLILWFVAGIFIIPTFLKKAKKMLDEETLLILSLGLCLLMVVLATQVGFSAELGAFIMGSILAETTSAEKIEHITKPVKDLFGAVFFVSVGMMIDPAIMVEYALPILWVTLLVLGGKLLSTTVGAVISGQPLKQSVQVGMSMAQVGEFAFIVASLGLSLGVISDFLFPVAVGVSAITTFTTPYMIKYSDQMYELLVKILPRKWISRINAYSSGTREIQTESSWRTIIKSYINIVVTNSIIVVAVFLAAVELLLPLATQYFEKEAIPTIIVLVIALAAASPFLWAIMAKRPALREERALWADNIYYRGPILTLEISRMIVGTLLIGFLLERLFSTMAALLIGIPAIIIVFILSSKGTRRLHGQLERLFFGNLSARDNMATTETPRNLLHAKLRSHPLLEPWEAHVVDMKVPAEAHFIGIPLRELAWREKFGVNVIYIRRGAKLIFAPGKDDCFYVHDQIGIIGTDDQIQKLKPVFESPSLYEMEEQSIDDIVILPVTVNPDSNLKGLSLRNSGIREATDGLIVGMERGHKRTLNPDSLTQIETGDVLWIAGIKEKIQKLVKDISENTPLPEDN